ncbi:malonyl-CoA decarboxylase [Rhizobium sp. LEGMi198b]
MNSTSLLGDLFAAIADRGRRLLSLGSYDEQADPMAALGDLCDILLSGRGEASGMALARDILDRWRALDEPSRLAFSLLLLSRFGPDANRLDRAIEAYRSNPSAQSAVELNAASEPRRQELIRRLNLSPDGTATLVDMRRQLLAQKVQYPELEALDADFAHLLGSWFNRGFLELRAINWSTPADILEKIIRYEAVHEIRGWDDLRRRLAPTDRRCFAFFHPRLPDEPLIFVEVALTRAIPNAIDDLLREDRLHIPAAEATTAVFYSISNCQEGLRGISFGNFLIKQVVEDLRHEFQKLDTFVTLSPVPGFAAWLDAERRSDRLAVLDAGDRAALAALDTLGEGDPLELLKTLQPIFGRAAAFYFLKARDRSGRVIDPVARFHLGNGARLERINFLADRSPQALKRGLGLMVNYLYKQDDIEANHENFVNLGEVAASSAVKRLLTAEHARRPIFPAGESSEPVRLPASSQSRLKETST